MKNYKYKIFISIFLIIIYLPLILSILEDTFEIKIDKNLSGYVGNFKKPKFTIKNYKSSLYQKEFINWWDNNFVPRGTMMRTYNQFRKTVFSLSNRAIIGKNSDMYEESYIDEFLGISEINNFSYPDNKKRLDDYIMNLNKLSSKLRLLGKELLVYTTPNKVNYNYMNIPWRYSLLRKDNIRAIDYFRSKKDMMSFKYIDGAKILNEKTFEYPIFYDTGIHLSRISEQYLSSEVLKNITDIKKFNIGEVKSSKTPYWRDSDISDLTNIWFQNKNIYYKSETIKTIEDKYKNKKFTIQGGSYGEGLRKDIIENYISGDVNYILYNLFYIDKDSYISLNQLNKAESFHSDWSSIDFNELLSKTDVLIIELNEKHMTYCSNGFVEYINKYIDENKIIVRKNHIKNLDIFDDYNKLKFDLYGYYIFENGYVWAKKYSSVLLSNENIIDKGMDIIIEIPIFWDFKKLSEIKIYINGEIKKSLVVDGPGEVKLHFSNITISENKVYTVEIYASQDFNPQKDEILDDNRDLSIMVKYIGEAR